MRRLSAAFALLPLLVLSCRLPPYNEGLSLAQLSARDMDPVAAVGPFSYWPGELEGKQVTFHPSKDALHRRLTVDSTFPLRGFFLAVGEYSVRLVFVNYDEWEKRYYPGPDQMLYLDTSDPERFAYVAQSIKDGAPGLPEHIGAAIFTPEGERRYVRFDEWFAEASTDLNAAGRQAIGAGLFPVDGPFDSLYVLQRTGAGQYNEEAWKTSTGAALVFDLPIRAPSLPGLPEQIQSAFYHHNPDALLARRSYLSWYDPARRGYRNFWWDDSMALHVMTHVEKRIDLLLSNGWLFSRGENLGYLYDADGRFLNQFALGGLDLVCEIHVAGVPHAVFTMEAWAPGGRHENPRLHFLVYTLPTSGLADL